MNTVDRRAVIVSVWALVLLILCASVGLIALAQFFPPPSPRDSAAEIRARYLDDATGIKAGCILLMVSGILFPIWASSLVAKVRQMEIGIPVLATAMIAVLGAGTAIPVINFMVWSVAAFRPGDLPIETLRIMNDAGWFLFLWTAPIFSMFNFLLCLAQALDRSPQPVLPRWTMYMTGWAGVLFLPGVLIAFFKHGAFAYNGFAGFWIPVVVFFGWMSVLSWVLLQTTPAAERPQPAAARHEQHA